MSVHDEIGIDHRVKREQSAYDEGLRRGAYNTVFRHTHYLSRQKRRRIVAELLRSVPHGTVLELGAVGWLPFLEENAIVPDSLVCINISQRELDQGVAAARHTRLQPNFQLMDAHRLAFPDHHFDVVFGISILHHLEFETALHELRRVLKPGGLVLFAEPLDNNPIARLVRRLTPRARTEDERPFRHGELALMRRYFDCTFYFEQFLSVPLGLLSGLLQRHPDNLLTRAALRLDGSLVQALPKLGPYYRHVLIAGKAS
jgi:SAM-dependent methyltransferase